MIFFWRKVLSVEKCLHELAWVLLHLFCFFLMLKQKQPNFYLFILHSRTTLKDQEGHRHCSERSMRFPTYWSGSLPCTCRGCDRAPAAGPIGAKHFCSRSCQDFPFTSLFPITVLHRSVIPGLGATAMASLPSSLTRKSCSDKAVCITVCCCFFHSIYHQGNCRGMSVFPFRVWPFSLL